MGGARSKADRGAIPVVRVDTACDSALTRWASSSHAGRRGRFSWQCRMLASLSRARVSSIAYVQ
eukprot:1612409-Prymnesium_polylepis.1